jgi:[ribosomal protein S18]-alanine N-acetyltransferase
VNIQIRDMEAADVVQVALIEASSFSAPWSRVMFQDELVQKLSWHRVAVDAAEDGETVVGYLIGRLYMDVWHLMNLAVAADYRCRGVGTALLEEFIHAAAGGGRDVLLEARPSNAAALALYSKHGFELIAVRRRYYTDNQEDAFVLEFNVKKTRAG